MATIKEIAKACNVSIATVSNILNGKPGASEATRSLVLRTVEKMDYTPNYVAKNLKMKNTRSIGVIAEDMTIFSIPDIIDGITEYCQEIDYQILLTNMRLFKKYNDVYYNKEDYYGLVKQEIRKLMAKQVEGIIYVTAHERIMHCIPDDLPIPAVMAYGYTQSGKVPSVVVDDEHGAYEAVQYLIKQGHRRIGVITGKSDSLHMQARLVGYQKALRDNGLLYEPELVYYGDWNRETGYKGAGVLFERKVTAIFCMNDIMAGGVYDRADEMKKKIPEEISVVGYDNRELSSYYKPPLTTITLPLHDIGYRAAEVMIEMLDGKISSQKEELVYQMPCRRLVRKSVQELKMAGK
ncbi:MAG TPA: LacI family DNA-binding transcriptional regulator [Candidatus Blautia stercoravium]|nr:LacI family DNA-binding transcriptional regulator [Candidatus Blautia stercoravium]